MTEKQFRVFKFPDVDKFGVSDDIAEVTVAFCDKKWEADYLCDLLNDLSEENEELKKELDEFKQPNCKKCIHYSVDSAGTYCMCENGLLNGAWEMFPFEWDYSNAKNCKEYEE